MAPPRPPSGTRARRWGRFPTTADVGIWATGADAGELLEGLGLAFFALLADPRRVRPTEERSVQASGRDPSEMAVAFLGELLLLYETDTFVGRRIEARVGDQRARSVVARVRGERFDPARHLPRTEVKAITYHRLVFDPKAGRARVIVDL